MKNTITPWYKRKSTLFVTAAIVAVCLLVLSVIPYVIGHGVKQWILANGDDRVSIEDVDFNPFTGSLAIRNLHAERVNTTPLVIEDIRLNLSWSKLLQNRVIIEGAGISGVSLIIEQESTGQLRVGGMPGIFGKEQTESAQDSAAWVIDINDLALHDIDIRYIGPDISSEFHINRLVLKNFASHTPEQSAELIMDATLDGAETSFHGRIKPFSETIHVAGKIELDSVNLGHYQPLLADTLKQINGKGKLNGRLSTRYGAGQLKTTLKGKVLAEALSMSTDTNRVTAGSISQDGVMEFDHNQLDKKTRVSLQGETSIRSLQLETREQSFSQDRWDWEGSSSLEQTGNLTRIRTSGRMDSFAAKLADKSRNLGGNYQKLSWAGELDMQNSPSVNDINASGQLTLDSLVLSSDRDHVLLKLQQLALNDMDIRSAGRYAAGSAVLNKLALDQQGDSPGLAYYGSITLEQPVYAGESGVSVNRIRITDASQLVQRNTRGKWNHERFINNIKAVTSANTPASGDKPARHPDSSPLPVKIGEITVAGKSKLVFEDHKVKPAFTQTMDIQRLAIQNLDSAKPGRPGRFEVAGTLGRRSRFSAKGEAALFADPLSMDATGELKAYPLPPLSSYTSTILGYTLDSGNADIDMKYKVNDGRLDAQHDLQLHKVAVTKLTAEQLAELNAKPDEIPLDTGLSLLRDKNNSIRIQLPIKGKIDNLQVDPSDIINQAVGKAMKTAARTYISVALFPYGTLIKLVELAGEEAMRVSLDPVVFEPGIITLHDKQQDYLAKVSKLMRERPEMRIRLCGIATATDYKILLDRKKLKKDDKPDRALQALAEQRAHAIEDLLLDRDKLEASRFVSCQPRLELEDDSSSPRVELTL